MMMDDDFTQDARQGVSHAREEYGSLERLAEAALLQANRTMSMWRPNISQIAREEISKLGDYSPQD
jgi:hypothetical protein